MRPHAREVLKLLSKHFEIIVYTASHKEYADKVIDILDEDRSTVSHRLYRQHCFKTRDGVYVKDLRIINRPLDKTSIVDNATYSYILQLNNGVPIIPFINNKQDRQLLHLSSFLMTRILPTTDVRPVLSQYFNNSVLQTAQSVNHYISSLL